MSKSPPNSPPHNARRPPPTRQTRSDFNLEPNPFEQSFSATPRSASSNLRTSSPQLHRESLGPTSSNDSDRPNSRSSTKHRSASPSRPVLPPLASISSPADQAYAWGYANPSLANSLRAGPLSPAMLAGPQQPSADHPNQSSSAAAAATQSGTSIQFDSNAFRTGFTPRFTPRSCLTSGTGLTPLVGGPVAFPPSPATASFLALMNNNASSGPGGSSAQTITPNTLNVLTGVLNGTTSGPGASNNYSHNAQHEDGNAAAPGAATNYIATASSAASTAANGLFLLSQAHQELTKREEAQARANGTATHNGNSSYNSANGVNGKKGSKRKSYDTEATNGTNANGGMNGSASRTGRKRTRANTISSNGGRGRRASSREDDGDDDDDDGDDGDFDDGDPDQGSVSGNGRGGRNPKKPETEEEKRRNFLERNRQAALKCRQRKKAWLAQLQAKVEFLSNENERLTSALVSSREEISRLSALVGGAGVVGIPGAGVGAPSINSGQQGQPVAMNVSLHGKGVMGGVGVGVAGGRGSGYGY